MRSAWAWGGHSVARQDLFFMRNGWKTILDPFLRGGDDQGPCMEGRGFSTPRECDHGLIFKQDESRKQLQAGICCGLLKAAKPAPENGFPWAQAPGSELGVDPRNLLTGPSLPCSVPPPA